MSASASSMVAKTKPIFGGNLYNTTEFAGEFGDLGTLIPFTVGYIVVNKFDPVGILVSLRILKIFVGLYFKTPVPIQPMKAIGASAIANPGTISPGMIWGSGSLQRDCLDCADTFWSCQLVKQDYSQTSNARDYARTRDQLCDRRYENDGLSVGAGNHRYDCGFPIIGQQAPTGYDRIVSHGYCCLPNS
jgi:hypothetical protein